ncbi:hypothetical protein [Aquicoccus sp.]|uniref:hypothetical protein n=1 Tax=Aquicoccus sp. TaxID=2055851 RepID=UPI003567D14F
MDLARLIGRSGIAGALVGLVFATWVNPATNQGFALLVVICVLAAIIMSTGLSVAMHAYARLRFRPGRNASVGNGQPDEQAPEKAPSSDPLVAEVTPLERAPAQPAPPDTPATLSDDDGDTATADLDDRDSGKA